MQEEGTAAEVFVSFGRIGALSLGGGNAMTKLIEEECVNSRGWLTVSEFGEMFGLCFLFPGLTQVKVAAMIGMRVAGLAGVSAARSARWHCANYTRALLRAAASLLRAAASVLRRWSRRWLGSVGLGCCSPRPCGIYSPPTARPSW